MDLSSYIILSIFLTGCTFFFFGDVLLKRNFRELNMKIKQKNKESLLIMKINKWKKKHLEDRVMKEIYESISFLRNIINIEKSKETTSEFIINKLSEKPGLLQKTYYKMLSEIRLGNDKKAIEEMAKIISNPLCAEFGNLIVQWDKISPEKLAPALISYQKTIREINITKEKKKAEAISEAIYFPVMLNVMLIFLNFIYIAYFLHQKDILNTIL